MVDPNWAGKIRNWWGSLLEREILSHQRWTASPEELARGIGDVARQARNVFVLHVSACTYAYVALLGSKDADFFKGAGGGGIRLPVLDTYAHPAIFFTAMPVLLIALTVYLNLYLGQLQRLQRRMAWIQRQGPAGIDPDTLYPWIGILAKQRTLFGAVLRIVFNVIVWCVAPYIVVLYWTRLLPFRGLLVGTLNGFGPPSARVVGLIAIAFIALVATWSALRKTIDSEFKIGPIIAVWAYAFRGVVLLLITTLVGWQWQLQRYVCRHVSIGLCRVDLSQSIISTPPSNGVPNAQGPQMAELNLDGAMFLARIWTTQT